MMAEREMNYENSRMHTAHTIERQLKLYAKSEDATERHQVLWHSWNQNKRWLAQMLEWTLPSIRIRYCTISSAFWGRRGLNRFLRRIALCYCMRHICMMWG